MLARAWGVTANLHRYGHGSPSGPSTVCAGGRAGGRRAAVGVPGLEHTTTCMLVQARVRTVRAARVAVLSPKWAGEGRRSAVV